jgi:hypothetical protein
MLAVCSPSSLKKRENKNKTKPFIARVHDMSSKKCPMEAISLRAHNDYISKK